jgi:hypothetical protein
MKAAVWREKTAYLEKARMESTLQTHIEQIQLLDTELKAAVSRHEILHEERSAMKHIQFLKTELKAA